MKYRKTITVGIDVPDVIAFFANANPAFEYCSKLYNGKCYAECYIVKIIEIVAQSDCVVSNRAADVYGTFNVTFEADVIELLPGDIVSGCKVTKAEANSFTGIMTGNELNANITLNSIGIYKAIAVGQIVPIRVILCRYKTGANAISIAGEPYQNVPAYCFVAKPLPGANSLEILRELIASELAQKPAKSDQWTAFYSLFGPVTPSSHTIDILTAAEGTKLTVTGNWADGKAMSAEDPAAKEITYFDMLNRYYNQLKLLRESVEIYDIETFKANATLWRVYKALAKK